MIIFAGKLQNSQFPLFFSRKASVYYFANTFGYG